ncbi:MAG TPA: hypothetical protein DG753_07455 [Clostridium sp.]|nr:hypothetical protein [Clostridium sp.]
MNEEIMRVLKMIEEGKITADKAKEIIDALKQDKIISTNTPAVIEEEKASNYEDKFLKIKVLSAEGDKVNVQFPVKVIKEVIKVTGKIPMSSAGLEGVDMQELLNTVAACLDNESMGQIVDISSKNGDIVKIVIE